MNLFNLLVLGYALAASAPSSKTLKLDFHKVKKSTSSTNKRSTDNLAISNQEVYYATELELGSNRTPITFQLDTGSSDLWVDNQAFTGSSTLQETDQPFSITYGDLTGASGEYAKDTIQLGDFTVKQAQFGYASENTAGQFVWGIGLPAGEADATWDGTNLNSGYDNIPVLLKKQGFISDVAYSLWLDDYDSSTGAVLFGGVDHAKYDGTLGKVPIIATAEYASTGDAIHPHLPDRLTVSLNSISATNSKGESGTIISDANIPVLLDSGTTLTYLPNDWVTVIAASLGATYDSQYGYVLPKGDTPDKPTGSIDYNFSGVEIKTPFASFVREVTDNYGNPVYWDDAQQYPKYYLGLLPGNSQGDGVNVGDGTIYILGDTFLSGAYVVFDLDNLEIALAPAKSGTITEENIEAISNGIPSATQAPHYSATQTSADYSSTTLSIF